ncbi:MAG: hypothetical protein U1F98_03640 [Verrucomicrobiota bacterium]
MNAVKDSVKQAAAEAPKAPAPVLSVQFENGVPPVGEPAPGRLTLPAVVFGAILLAFLVMGVVFLRQVRERNELKVAARTPDTVPAASAPAPVSLPAPENRTQPAVPAPAVDPAAQVIAAPPAPDPLKLQAIFFSPNKPSAMIGGKTVFVGDRVQGFRVSEIGKDRAVLVNAGQTNVLKL